MVHCRYVGSDESTIGEREFGRVGEIAMFGEALFRDAVLGGAPFIPEASFKMVDFSGDELAAFGLPENRDLATASFTEKLAKAQQVFRGLQSEIASEGLAGMARLGISENLGQEEG